jgi:hypothetical protein
MNNFEEVLALKLLVKSSKKKPINNLILNK